MQSLASVTIDAGVIAVPDVDGTDCDPHEYVEQLAFCGDLLNRCWIDVHMSEQARDDLVITGLYPRWDQLRELFDSHNVIAYDVPTIQTVVNQIMAITPSFEDYFQVFDIAQDNVETTPDISLLHAHDSLQDSLERCVSTLTLLRRYCPQSLVLGGHVLFIRKALCRTIKVRANIHELDHNREDIPALIDPPLFFEGDVLVCDDCQRYFQCLDASTMLVGSNDDRGFEIALKVKLYKHAIEQSISVDWQSLNVPSIGSKFRASCQQVCSAQATALPDTILRTIVKIVYKLNPQETHALRTGSGPNNPQQRRGSDKAFRRNVDRSFRLHYWEGEQGAIELASVNYHNDFDIPS